ncbi:MAG: hypothetical protein ACI8UZ_002239 [Akkermansiaceae bacterium]|jgi:hypothetical protein
MFLSADVGNSRDKQERDPTGAETESYDQSATWQPKEIPLDDGRILILDDS